MNWYRREPTITEMLSDSIVRSLMRADGVEPNELEAMLKRVAGARTGDRWMRFRMDRASADKIEQEARDRRRAGVVARQGYRPLSDGTTAPDNWGGRPKQGLAARRDGSRIEDRKRVERDSAELRGADRRNRRRRHKQGAGKTEPGRQELSADHRHRPDLVFSQVIS